MSGSQESGVQEILAFWLDEVGPKGWYKVDHALDQSIRDQFEDTWNKAMKGSFSLWLTYPSGALAYIILMDQFSRNMFRGTGKAFASDRAACAAAKAAIGKRWDQRINEPSRQFFYMPLMHSENLVDQERCVRLLCERMPETGANALLHARAHREVIRQFGRFPTRNDALGRNPTTLEVTYIRDLGYGGIMRELQAVAG
ncbi:MAG: DUF924 domain-containing protein [Rhodobacteraceae bacterium]|nr:DUF924 domain-containing protein [Paracoccaceae bacterium]